MLSRVAEWLGIAAVQRWDLHERERALQRFVACFVVAAVDAVAAPWPGGGLPLAVLVVGSAYGLLSLGCWWSLRRPRRWHAVAAAAFLVADPAALLATVAAAPETFVFLVPLLLVVNTGPGLRYGTRAMHVSLAVSAATVAVLVAAGPFWRQEPAWSAALVLSLVLAPLFFRTQVRRIHDARRIEEERASLDRQTAAVTDRAVFLSKVSHELRSPLQSMVSALDVFELRHRDAALFDAELISRMRRASMLLNTQLRDLLTLAKGEAGRLQLSPDTFDAGELLRALAEEARPMASARRLDLHVRLPDEPVFVVADGARIDQVLTNLVVNSIRYTDAGAVRVELHPFAAADRTLRFSVADTGRGIPTEDLSTLFEPERRGATTARRGEGSGIGLAIVRILTEQLGGTVRVTSDAGTGTLFELEIPVRLPQEHRGDGASETVADGHR